MTDDRPCGIDRAAVAAIDDTPVDWRFKGWPADGATIGQIAGCGWHALEQLPAPVMLLHEAALDHNLRTMADWCRERGVLLAPHGKTTMAPQLFERQINAGAWAITAATVAHARVYRRFGIDRILLANQPTTPQDVAWLASEAASGAVDLICLVDDEDVADMLGRAAARSGSVLDVMIEVGHRTGRGGVRSLIAAERLAAAIGAHNGLRLVGIEGYEGLLGLDPSGLAAVDAFLERIAAAFERIATAGAFRIDAPLLSAGGSGWYDRVVDVLAAPARAAGGRLVVRSGCYLTHDHAFVARLGASSRAGLPTPRPALEAWAPVLSAVEDGRAILGAGRRDLPYDADLPIPLEVWRDGRFEPADGLRTVGLNDQHAHVAVTGEARPRPGDLVSLGISHPCSAFDRWSLLALVDEDRIVTGAVRTFF